MLQFLDLLRTENQFSSLVFLFNAPMVLSIIVKFQICDKNLNWSKFLINIS